MHLWGVYWHSCPATLAAALPGDPAPFVGSAEPWRCIGRPVWPLRTAVARSDLIQPPVRPQFSRAQVGSVPAVIAAALVIAFLLTWAGAALIIDGWSRRRRPSLTRRLAPTKIRPRWPHEAERWLNEQ